MIESGRVKKSDLKAIIAKGLLPYRGLGSGIKRALEAWPEIDFIDDRDGCLFTATVYRKSVKSSVIGSVKINGSPKSSEKSSEKILNMLKAEPELSAKELAKRLEISPRGVEKQIAKLREEGLLNRLGPDKGGRWEVR